MFAVVSGHPTTSFIFVALFITVTVLSACSPRRPSSGLPAVPARHADQAGQAYQVAQTALTRGQHALAVAEYHKSLQSLAELDQAGQVHLQTGSGLRQIQVERELAIAQRLARKQGPAVALADSVERFRTAVLDGFYPYRQGWPRQPGVTPGRALEGGKPAPGLLPPEILSRLEAGAFSITVQETTDLPPGEEYVAATITAGPDVRLAAQRHKLEGYTEGLPFPQLNPDDPQAGLKLAWNLRFREGGDQVEQWHDVIVLDDVHRILQGYAAYSARACGLYRARHRYIRPEWKQAGVVCKEYVHTAPLPDIPPPASRNGAHGANGASSRPLRMVRFWYDNPERPTQQWSVSSRRRYVKRIAYNPEANSIGATSILEDEEIWGGSIARATWRLLSAQLALVPGILKTRQVQFGGRDSGYPLDPWELRQVYIVEVIPHSPTHPYSRKILYIDQQTYVPFYAIIFDRQNTHWRTIFYSYGDPAFLPTIKEVRVPVLLGQSWIDYRTKRTTLSLVSDVFYNDSLSLDVFSLNGGRR